MNNLSILQNYDGNIKTSPFPHIIIKEALPWDLYEELSSSFPLNSITKKQYCENKLYDLPARKLLKNTDTPTIWYDFVSYHTSHTFWREIVEVFEEELLQAYDGSLDDCVNTRGVTQSGFMMDCQVSINTPAESIGTVRGPHVDNPKKLVAGLFYMRKYDDDSTGGNLGLYKEKGELKFYYKTEIFDETVEVVDWVPYEANTLVMFVNSLHSIHGVSNRSVTPHYRRYVNFVTAVSERLFEIPNE